MTDDVQQDAPLFSQLEPQINRAAAAPNSTSGKSGTSSSLRLRRSGQQNLLTMDLETISSSSRDSTDLRAQKARFRGWWRPGGASLEPLLNPTAAPRGSLRVVSYNILAARYTSSDTYTDCPLWALGPQYRAANVMREIQQMDPHIIILQELTSAVLDSPELGGSLRLAGYDVHFVPITVNPKQRETSDSLGTGNWIPSADGEHEGVGIFWKKDLFTLHEKIPINFNSIAQSDRSLTAAERRQLTLSSHNVAAVSVLQENASKTFFIVAGIHSFFDATKPACQLWQVHRLLREIESLSAVYDEMGHVTTVIGGDFNCEPHGPSLQYALRGDTASLPKAALTASTKDSSHTLELASAYALYQECFPNHITVFSSAFAGVVDHLLYQPRSMECAAVARLLEAQPIPNAQIPSDHLPICAWLIPRHP